MIDYFGYSRGDPEVGYFDTSRLIEVCSCGYQKCITRDIGMVPGRLHGRVDYQAIYTVSGISYFQFDGEMKAVEEGHVVIYRPFETQCYLHKSETKSEVFWIHFTGSGVESFLGEAGLTGGNIFPIGISERYIELFKKIITELQIKRPHYVELANSYFLELLSLVTRKLRDTGYGSQAAMNSRLEQVVVSIHRNYNKEISISGLAQQCCMSRGWFISSFRKFTGMSPREYIIRLRINKAKELLSATALNISEISDLIGYENPLYFSRIFRKVTAISPSAYRKEHGDNRN